MSVSRILYWLSTGILTAIMLFSVYNYFFNHEIIVDFFEGYNYPAYLVYPLAIAKLLGLIAIWGNFSKFLKEWAYAGFFFNTSLALLAHLMAKDGGYLFSLLALICVLISYFTAKQIRP
ncbi:MAG: DoxX family protein [Flavobacteriaceae bacterium]